MDKFTTVVFRATTEEHQKMITEFVKRGYEGGIISGAGMGDEMTKLNEIRDLLDEGIGVWDLIVEKANS